RRPFLRWSRLEHGGDPDTLRGADPSELSAASPRSPRGPSHRTLAGDRVSGLTAFRRIGSIRPDRPPPLLGAAVASGAARDVPGRGSWPAAGGRCRDGPGRRIRWRTQTLNWPNVYRAGRR